MLWDRKLWTRGNQLRRVAGKIAEDGAQGIEHVLFDGFYSFTKVELDLVRALADQCDVTVTLPSWHGIAGVRDSLLGMGFQEKTLTVVRQKPKVWYLRAPNLTREAEEIARRIHGEVSAGRPFREIGVIVRSESAYVPALRTALERFGIPAHFYFGTPLSGNPQVLRAMRVVGALLGEWDHEELLAAIDLAPASNERDEFELRLRKNIPGKGLKEFTRLARGTSFEGFANTLRKLDPWRYEKTFASDWADHLAPLTGMLADGAVPDRISRRDAEVWQARASALREWKRSLGDTAKVFGAEVKVTLREFWDEAVRVVEKVTVRDRDNRRSVVHVMDAFEARQWELPVVFVCGLLEKEFPKYHGESPLLDDDARRAMQKRGFHLRTSVEHDRQEEFLFQIATTRATETLTLSYPAFTAGGDATLPSFLLQEFRIRRGGRGGRIRRGLLRHASRGVEFKSVGQSANCYTRLATQAPAGCGEALADRD